MKVVLKMLGYLIVLFVFYRLYQSQLGAIPFLVTSIVLFYLGYRLIPNPNEDNRAEEQPPK